MSSSPAHGKNNVEQQVLQFVALNKTIQQMRQKIAIQMNTLRKQHLTDDHAPQVQSLGAQTTALEKQMTILQQLTMKILKNLTPTNTEKKNSHGKQTLKDQRAMTRKFLNFMLAQRQTPPKAPVESNVTTTTSPTVTTTQSIKTH